MRTRTRIIIAIVCALLVALAFVSYADEVRSEAERIRSEAIARYGGEVTELVVSTRVLEAGETVDIGDVSAREWLADLVPGGEITDLDEVVGRVVTEPVAEGAPLTSINFRDATKAIDVPSGHVAVMIPATEKLGLSQEIEVGSKLIAYEVVDGKTKVCATEVVVLSAPIAQGSTFTANQTATVAVFPEDVSAVLSASSAGTLRVVLPAEDVDAVPENEAAEAPKSVPSETEGDKDE